MLKHLWLLWLTTIIWCGILLSWCDTGITNTWNKNSEVIWTLERFSKGMNRKAGIKEHNFQRFSFLDTEQSVLEIPWYSIYFTWVKFDDIPEANDMFNWWHVEDVSDEAFWSLVEFMTDKIVCNYSLVLEQSIPDELMAWEWEMDEEYDALWQEFYDKASYAIELSCWEFPVWTPKYDDLYFDAEGQEPFWNASFRWSMITLFDVNWVNYYYPNYIKYQWDEIILSWYNMNWKMIKEECIDHWRWASHDYSIDVNFINDDGTIHYEWCSDKVDFWFVDWEQWTLQNFVNKTNYMYNQPYKIENAWYAITEIAGNYTFVNVYINEDEEFHSYQIIMEKVDNERKLIFEWDWYNISDDKCEELNQYDNNLMEMSFLIACPRG